MPQLRSDQAAVHVSITGASLDKNVWTSMDGGDVEAQDTKTRPGGMGDEISLGGPRTRSDCTVERQYSNDVLHPLIPQLEQLCGAASMKVSWTPLDADGNQNGSTETITGILKHVKKPTWNANAQGATMLALVMSCNAAAATIS